MTKSDQTWLTLYLEVSPEQCYRRVHELRQREGEEGIPLVRFIACFVLF